MAVMAHGASETSGSVQLIIFSLAGESYATEIATVQEIITVPAITAIPRAPEFIEGVINLRGRVVAVIDLRKRFGLPASERSRATRIVVANVGDHTVGLIVDSVTRVLTIGQACIEPPSPVIANLAVDLIRGIANHDDRIIVLVDLRAVLTIRQLVEADAVASTDALAMVPA